MTEQGCSLAALLREGGPVRLAIRPCCLVALVGRRLPPDGPDAQALACEAAGVLEPAGQRTPGTAAGPADDLGPADGLGAGGVLGAGGDLGAGGVVESGAVR
jgi:hypothetical protein